MGDIYNLQCGTQRMALQPDGSNLAPPNRTPLFDINDQAAFHGACKRGDIETVKLLINRDDLDINTQDIWGKTAFFCACERGHIEIVKLLITRDDLNLDATNNWVRYEELR